MNFRDKYFWHGREFKFYDYLMDLRYDILKEFNAANPDFKNMIEWSKTVPPGWKLFPLRYIVEPINKERIRMMELGKLHEETCKDIYPTIYHNILKRWDKECNICALTVLEPGGIIAKHADHENLSASRVRIHVPLSVPTGDIGMEMCGETVDWSDLFVMSSQHVHSCWNFTDQPRIIMFLDLPREFCDLPPGIPYSLEMEQEEEKLYPFEKTNFKRLK